MIANPYIIWLIRRRRWLSLRRTLLLGLTPGLALSAAMFAAYTARPALQPAFSQAGWAAALLCIFLLLAAAVTIAIQTTFAEARGDRRQLLRVAGFPGAMLADSYAFKIILRLRAFLLLALGMAPAVVIGWAHRLASLEILRRCGAGLAGCQAFHITLVPVQLAALFYAVLSVMLVILAATVASVSASLWVTLRWQDRLLASGSALGLLAVALTPLLFFFALYLDVVIRQILMFDGWLSILPLLLILTLMGAIPYLLLGDACQRAARRWVWHNLVGHS